MFNDEFYPTPRKVIGKMLQPWLKPDEDEPKFRGYRQTKHLSNLTILEPSAGKGNILDFIQLHVSRGERELYAIEQDPELVHILRGKGYKVVANDFLNYTGDYLIDLIVMNPPFSNGVDHILHAWNILENGDIVSLINTETIKNLCSSKRELLAKIIEDHGSVEHIGQVFMNSNEKIKDKYHRDDEDEPNEVERTTSVECSIVRLQKIGKDDRFSFNFENVKKEKAPELNEETFKDPIATRDVIGNMIIQYDKIKELFVELLKIHEALKFYGQGMVVNQDISALDNALFAIRETGTKKKAYNFFCDIMKQDIWKIVISETNIQKYMTHNVRQNFERFGKDQGYMDFTKENVASLISMVYENRFEILDRAIVDVFDIFTNYYKDNRMHVEGWKTNDNWKVNRKIILPHWIRMSWDNPKDRIRYGAEYKLSYHHSSEYSDIDKVMQYITGKTHITSITSALEHSFRQQGKIYKGPHQAKCSSTFFDMQYYMKGTLHLTFRDEKLWEEFNLRACAGKQWLPPAEQRAYEESRKPKQKEPEKEVLMISDGYQQSLFD